jgi:hypothetical protein
MIQVCLASDVPPKTALNISSSLVYKQWGHFHSKTVVGFESCAVLPVVQELHFDPIVDVCLEDLVFVAIVGGDDGGKRTLS